MHSEVPGSGVHTGFSVVGGGGGIQGRMLSWRQPTRGIWGKTKAKAPRPLIQTSESWTRYSTVTLAFLRLVSELTCTFALKLEFKPSPIQSPLY